eukprot:8862911-Lingulodinium_polyedra.AAC.1
MTTVHKRRHHGTIAGQDAKEQVVAQACVALTHHKPLAKAVRELNRSEAIARVVRAPAPRPPASRHVPRTERHRDADGASGWRRARQGGDLVTGRGWQGS